MSKPIISICIPTFNREIYLKQCLNSILCQLNSNDLIKTVEIIVVDNNSKDKTENLVNSFRVKYKNLLYFNSKKNIPLAKGVINVGKYAKGKYIWFCSDDDIHYQGSIKIMINILKKHSPEVIYCNLDEYSKNMENILHRNSFEMQKDIYVHGRRDFFNFLNGKFFYAIDWFTTYYSNLVLSKEIFNLSYGLSKKYNSKFDLFPQSSAIFYSKRELDIYIISKPLIKYRGSNLSWGPKQKKDFHRFISDMHNNQYSHIIESNSDVISLSFKIRLQDKKIIKYIRMYILLPLFNY